MEEVKLIRTQQEKKVDVSFILYHLGNLKEESLIETIENYYNQMRIPSDYTVEVIVLLDGTKLKNLSNLQAQMTSYTEPFVIVEGNELFMGPGKMWNKGFSVCTGDVVAFVRTDIKWYPDSLLYLNRLLIQNHTEMSYGCVKTNSQASKSLEYMLMKRDVVKSLGGFCEDKEVTPIVDWDFVRRLDQSIQSIKLNGRNLILNNSLHELAYPYSFKQGRFGLIRRYLLEEEDEDQKEKFALTEHNANHESDTTFILYHYKSMLEDDLIYTIESYVKQRGIQEAYGIEIIVLLDGIGIKDLPILEQVMLRNVSQLIVIESDSSFLGPGLLWNKGLKIATGNWVVFTWTGALWYEDSLVHLRRLGIKNQVGAYGTVCYDEVSKESSYIPKVVGIGEIATQFISFINAIPLCYMIVKKSIAYELEGFISDREFAHLADWEFIIRLVRKFKMEALVGKRAIVKSPIGTTSFEYNFTHTIDEQIRMLIMNTSLKAHYKVAIISGLNESAQVQLSLLNYFEISEEPNTFSWRRFVENDVMAEEVADYDLVFFVRSRTPSALNVAKFCLEKGIKTIYLLDDNWFCATETYPQLESQIGKQTMPYLFFTLIASVVDCIFVYNKFIQEDIKAYNPYVIKMPINVNMTHFLKTSLKADTFVHIGFAGSGSKIQHFPAAFKALERIMQEFNNVHLYFKGIELPATFNVFKDRVIQEPYNFDYKEYAKQVSQWHYDIMISPLDHTRYINSKCVNKYLEVTAAGAAGIYTNIPLYQKIIKNRVNGLLIDNEENEWYESVKLLILDKILRKEIIYNAQVDIKEHYETYTVLPRFLSVIKQVLGKGGGL